VTGTTAWEHQVSPITIYSSLPASTDGTLVVVSPGSVLGEGIVSVRNPADGSELWRTRIGSFVSPLVSPAVTPAAIYAADFQGGLHAISTATHEQLWQFQFNERVLRSSPVVVGDDVALGLSDGSLGVVDARTGHLVWRSATAPGGLSSLAVAQDLVLAVRTGGRGGLVAFRHDDAGSLVDVESPTVPVLGTILGRWVVASALIVAIVVVPLAFVSRTVGSITIDASEDDDEEDEEDDDEGDDE
jgi:outer membrane protein assembly factor BamB